MSLAKALQTMADTPKPRVPERPSSQVLAPSVKVAKRSDPDRFGMKAYVLSDLHKKAVRRAEDEGYDDFSDLVEELLKAYVKGGREWLSTIQSQR